MIRTLEFHITHACNMACQSCSHFSDFGMKGMIKLDDAIDQWNLWANRTKPAEFCLLGGEPTLNSQLVEFVAAANKIWKTRIKVITNGWYLHKFPDLPKVLESTGTILEISQHHDSHSYRDQFTKVVELVELWQLEYKINVTIRAAFEHWRRMWKFNGDRIKPFHDDDPKASWDSCGCRHCIQLFEGKLYKCPPLTYLKLLNRSMKLHKNWDKYLEYMPLESTCSDDELAEFVFRRAETYCSMCPAYIRPFRLPNPLKD